MNRFREAREYLGFKPREACRLFKVTLEALEELESSRAVPSREVLGLASRLYGRPPAWLLGTTPRDPLEVPRALIDLVRRSGVSESDPDVLELARFAEYLRHRAEVRGIA